MSFRIGDDEYSADNADDYKTHVEEELTRIVEAKGLFCGCLSYVKKRILNRTEATQICADISDVDDMGDTLSRVRIKVLALALYLENDGGAQVNQRLKTTCYLLAGAGFNSMTREVITNDEFVHFVGEHLQAIAQDALALQNKNRPSNVVTIEHYQELLRARCHIVLEEPPASPMKDELSAAQTEHGRSLQ